MTVHDFPSHADRRITRAHRWRRSQCVAALRPGPELPGGGSRAPGRDWCGSRPTRIRTGPGPAARAAIQAAIGDGWKYPMTEEMTLKAQIAEREGLTPQHVMIGDGSIGDPAHCGLLYGLDRRRADHSRRPRSDWRRTMQGRSARSAPRNSPRQRLPPRPQGHEGGDHPPTRGSSISATRTTRPARLVSGAELREFIAGVPPDGHGAGRRGLPRARLGHGRELHGLPA